jgi:hypothetical protein
MASNFRQCVTANFSFGTFRFLSLDGLIAAKEAAGRGHDMLAVKRLRAVRERLKRQND